MRAAALNFADVLIRRGQYPQMPEFPAIIGAELAGELEDGTRVMALAGHGGYAELAAVHEKALVPLPEHASFAEGAAFLLTFLTAYVPLTRQVVLRDDSTVLVYAAAGGVGTATIQVARALGATVIAAAGSPEKLELCRELGATEAYLYDEIPDDLRVDVVVDPIGGDLFEAGDRAPEAARPARSDRVRGRDVARDAAGEPRRPERRTPGRLPRPAHAPRTRRRGRVHARAARAVERREDQAARRRGVPARGRREGARAPRVAQQRRQDRPAAVRALVTGGRGGIGAAIAAHFDDPLVLDLPEFDVGDPDAWRALDGEFDAAFLNAGIGIGYADVAELPDAEWQRILRANLDGVVYGTRELAARLMPNGGSIVATASLAGLTDMPHDPSYSATKAAVIGWVRASAPGLAAHGIRINAICPGFADTNIVTDELRDILDVPLMDPAFVADAALQVLNDSESGRAWVIQPNRVVPFEFRGVPGPR